MTQNARDAAAILWQNWQRRTRIDAAAAGLPSGRSRRSLLGAAGDRQAVRPVRGRMEDRRDERGRPEAHRRGRPARRPLAGQSRAHERRGRAARRQHHEGRGSGVRVHVPRGPADARDSLHPGRSARRRRLPASRDRSARLALQRLRQSRSASTDRRHRVLLLVRARPCGRRRLAIDAISWPTRLRRIGTPSRPPPAAVPTCLAIRASP